MMDTNEFEHILREKDELRSEEYDSQVWFHPKNRDKDYFHVEIEKEGKHKGAFELAVYSEKPFSVISSPKRKKFDDELKFAQFVIRKIIEDDARPKELDYYERLFSNSLK